MPNVNVSYAFTQGARGAVANATGSLDPNAGPKPNYSHFDLIPHAGDVLTWDSLPGLVLVVATRQIKYLANGDVEMVLLLNSAKP